MDLFIKEQGCNTSKGVNFIPYKKEAEQLFKDFGFKHQVETIGRSKEQYLTWDWGSNEIKIPFSDIFATQKAMSDFTIKYDCQILLTAVKKEDGKKVMVSQIDFNQWSRYIK